MVWPNAANIACVAWALLVGASVTLHLCCAVHLNKRSAAPQYHAFYVASIGVLIGGVLLLPRALSPVPPYQGIQHKWSLLGGFCVLPAFLSIPAGAAVGVQIVLLTQLFALLGTALVFDVRRGLVGLSDWKRLVGFAVVSAGVLLDNFSAGLPEEGISLSSIFLLVGVFLSGIGFAVQAKCNSRLAEDLGHISRATVISAAVNLVSGLPIACLFLWGFGVRPSLSVAVDWPLWLFIGCQSAFYIGSLAVLPELLGYTTAYLVLLLGKLVSSTFADMYGLTGTVVPLNWVRAAALGLVLFGTGVFSLQPTYNKLDDEFEGSKSTAFRPPFTLLSNNVVVEVHDNPDQSLKNANGQ